MRKQKRQTVKKLIQCVAIIAAGVLAIILFMWVIWYRGKNSIPVAIFESMFRKILLGETEESEV